MSEILGHSESISELDLSYSRLNKMRLGCCIVVQARGTLSSCLTSLLSLIPYKLLEYLTVS